MSATDPTESPWIVVHHDEDRVVLVGQWRYTHDRYSWGIPEGGVPADEDLLEGARRELREETGVEAAAWRPIVRFDLSNSVTDESGVLYLATGLAQGEPMPDGTEELTVRRVPFAEVLRMADAGEITDAMTLLGLERVARLRAAGEA